VLVANKVRDVSDIVCKIADFGISKSLHVNTDTLQETAGTPAFMSPQVIESR
jgi:serine/threonine protein kinase